jgi:hypothetical protein
MVSINQIGVGVWGWIFTGALYGYSNSVAKSRIEPTKVERNSNSSNSIYKDSKKLKSSLLPPLISLLGAFGFLIGSVVSYFPLSADAAYKKALQSQSIEALDEATDRMGSTAFHKELVLESAIRSNLTEKAGNIAVALVEKYPRDYYGWRILALISPPGSPERSRAIDRLIELDPFNKESLPSP